METAAMEAAANPVASTSESAMNDGMSATIRTSPANITRPSIAISRMPIDRVPVKAAAIAVATITVVIPGACADKHTARKPRRPIIPIRSAGIGVRPVISVSTGRRIPIRPISRSANSDADRNLGVSRCGGNQQNTNETE